MKKMSYLFAVAFCLAALSATAKADTTFGAVLNGAQERPSPVDTAAKGFGIAVLNAAETQVTVSLAFTGLSSNETGAHIHAPANASSTASILFDLDPAPAIGTTSGNIGAPVVFAVTAQQVADLKAGLWYFNVHSVNFPDGEIRGQIVRSPVRISEFRFRGADPDGAGTATGASNEFIEIYNHSDHDLTVLATDGSAGWALTGLQASGNGSNLLVAVPNGTVIPARGHFLFTDTATGGYALTTYAAGDAAGNFTTGISDNAAVGVWTVAALASINVNNRLDSAAFAGAGTARPAYIEGTALTAIGTANLGTTDISHVRNLKSGVPQDTDDNAADFIFVSTTGAVFGIQPTLGAPGPENTQSPIQRNNAVKASPIDTCVAVGGPPNRVRDLTGDAANNSTNGTLSIRRKFTNNTGAPLTSLRFRIVDITTCTVAPCSPATGATAPAGTADLRARSSTSVTVSISAACGGGTIDVQGTTLEEPPAQPEGGGMNSSLAAGTVTLQTPLAAGASINVQFLLGVEQTGTFRFFVNVEALPGGAPFAPDKATTKASGARKLGR